MSSFFSRFSELLHRPVRFAPPPRATRELVLAWIVLYVTSIRAYVWLGLPPDVHDFSSLALREWSLWLLACGLALFGLRADGLLGDFLEAWRRQKALVAFVAMAFTSICWSNYREATLHRSGVLLFSSIVAVAFGVSYDVRQLRRGLLWGFATLIVASGYLIAFRPRLGTDPNIPYDGAWRGLFWQKNHLGSVVALFLLVYVVTALSRSDPRARRDAAWSSPVLLLALAMLRGSDSASAILVAFLTVGAAVALRAGIALWPRLRRVHLTAAGVALIALATWAFSRLDFFLDLLGRNKTLTGRTDLWSYLLDRIVPAQPWLGVGFGTLWSQPEFRWFMRREIGWRYPVVIADNGFLDLLVNVGLVGLSLFLVLYAGAWRIALREGMRQGTLEAWFGALFLLYTLVANLSYSLFFETENLVWFTMVALLVATSRCAISSSALGAIARGAEPVRARRRAAGS